MYAVSNEQAKPIREFVRGGGVFVSGSIRQTEDHWKLHGREGLTAGASD
jgi:hypothetical protein